MKGFYKFFVISACGWLLDVLITMTLVQFDLNPFSASMIGAGTAVTFVYIVSLLAVFEVDRISGVSGYVPYVLWQIFSISVASALVSALAHLIEPLLSVHATRLDGFIVLTEPLSWASGIAKALVTPLTLAANFFFMRWLTGRLRMQRDGV